MNLLLLLADILFIGTGLFGAQTPQMVGAAGRMAGADAEVVALAGNEAPLAYYWSTGGGGIGEDPREVLKTGDVDYLVMSEAGVQRDMIARPDTAKAVSNFAELAERSNPQVRTRLVESWPPLGVGPDAARDWQAAVRDAAPEWRTLAASAEGKVKLMPLAQGIAAAGDAILAGEVPGVTTLRGLFRDDRQLNARGSYFAAMLFYAVMGETNPDGLPVWLGRNRPATLEEAVTEPMAAAFQRIAWQVAQEQAQIPVPQPQGDLRSEVVAAGDDAGNISARPAAGDAGDIPTSYLTGVARPGVAFNLAEVNDWSVEQPFLDVFKTARPWIGHLEGQWGGFEEPRLREEGYLDAQGWPTAIPPGVSGIGTLVLTDLPEEMAAAAGRYVLTYEGEGEIWLEGLVQNVASEPGRMAFDFKPGKGAVLITLKRIAADDPIRNIRIVRQDRLPLAEQGEIFNPDFLARMRGVEMIRFMLWMRANNAQLSHVEEMPKPDDYTWGTPRGVPPEVMIALANELDADPWFTMSHLADDDLVRAYARTVRDGLKPDRRAIVEFSNEIWNWIFDQAHWADQKAQEEWNARDAWVEYGAYRAAQVADIWAEEFGDAAPDRLVRVIGAFTGWEGIEDQLLTAPQWKKARPDDWRAPYEAFDAYAITGYFSANFSDENRARMLQGWIDDSVAAAQEGADAQGLTGAEREAYIHEHRFDTAFDVTLREIRDGGSSGETLGTVKWLNDEVFPYQRRVADKYGLELLMYEGGTHAVAVGAGQNDEVLTDFYTALNYTPGMAELTELAWQGWKAVSDEPFNFFADVIAPSRYGSWGVLRYLDDDNPRWQMLTEPEQ